jgi:hypothetical protein
MEERVMNTAWTRGFLALLAATGLLVWAQPAAAHADDPPSADPGQGFKVDADIALSSLQSLADGHLQKMADSMHMLAASDAARSADWERIKGPFAELAKRNVTALNWFARPDGTYWSLQDGKEPGNLSGRDYFPRVLAGEDGARTAGVQHRHRQAGGDRGRAGARGGRLGGRGARRVHLPR